MKAMILVLSATLLTACSSGSVKNCRMWPSGGVSDVATGKEIAKYINEGHAAWESCYTAVKGQ